MLLQAMKYTSTYMYMCVVPSELTSNSSGTHDTINYFKAQFPTSSILRGYHILKKKKKKKNISGRLIPVHLAASQPLLETGVVKCLLWIGLEAISPCSSAPFSAVLLEASYESGPV